MWLISNIHRFKRAMGEGILVLFDQGLLSIATFITGILIAKGTNKESFGVYILCWSLLNIILTFSDALINKPFALHSPSLTNDIRKKYQGSTFIHTLIFCSLVSTSLFIILQLTDTALPSYFTFELALAISITLFPYIFRKYMRSTALAHLHVGSGVLANAISSCLQIITLYLLYQYQIISVTLAYYTIAACSCISAIMIFIKEKDFFAFDLSTVYNHFHISWQSGKWLLLNATAFSIVSQAYPWLLAIMLDVENIAIYGACMSIAAVAAPLLRGIDAYILPRMTHGLNNKGQNALFRILWMSTIIVSIPYLVWLLIATLFADFLLNNLYSSDYIGHTILLGLLLFKNLIDSATSQVTNALMSLGQTKHTSYALLFGMVSTSILGPLLIHNIGLNGAGIAAVISALIIASYKWYILLTLQRNSTA